ncbi:hypothetical protein [Taylorella equigenitalis]|uniref:hypothetical protein n=1 Tax=Taylorella equigenitalis TaxID=29575 RepID=UPI0002EAEAFC|nr:hypothetical protein CA604_00530 [Taylorella equigenitalis]VEG30241.1 Transposase and inactivated derivatives [Taylorella equigenitalis ATCC 35865]
MFIKNLYQLGYSIKLTKELDVSRNTVRKYLREEKESSAYSPRENIVIKLDPYKSYLSQRIAQAHSEWIATTVIFREIVKLGYEGKIRILSEYVRNFKPKAKEEPLVRFETEPGRQTQVDFTIIRSGVAKNNPLKAFVTTLGYSRASNVI